MFRRIARLDPIDPDAGGGTGGGDFIHKDPENPPRYDLRKLKTQGDPDLEQDDPDLDMTDPDLHATSRRGHRRQARPIRAMSPNHDPKVAAAEKQIADTLTKMTKDKDIGALDKVTVEIHDHGSGPTHSQNVFVSIVTMKQASRSPDSLQDTF